MIDALVAFAPIPENINAPSNTLDVTVDESESGAVSETDETVDTEITTEEETTP